MTTDIGLWRCHVRPVPGGMWIQHGPDPDARRFFAERMGYYNSGAIRRWVDSQHANGCRCEQYTIDELHDLWRRQPLPDR